MTSVGFTFILAQNFTSWILYYRFIDRDVGVDANIQIWFWENTCVCRFNSFTFSILLFYLFIIDSWAKVNRSFYLALIGPSHTILVVLNAKLCWFCLRGLLLERANETDRPPQGISTFKLSLVFILSLKKLDTCVKGLFFLIEP